MKEYSFQDVKLSLDGVEVTSFADNETIVLDFETLEFHVLALQSIGKLPPGLYQAMMFGSPKPRQITAREIKKNNWHTPFHPSVINTTVAGSHEPWKRNNRLVGKRSRKSK